MIMILKMTMILAMMMTMGKVIIMIFMFMIFLVMMSSCEVDFTRPASLNSSRFLISPNPAMAKEENAEMRGTEAHKSS